MDLIVLDREDRQPIWMRMNQDRSPWGDWPTRKHQILVRLANCIREASPSVERSEKRKLFLATVETFLTEDFDGYIDIMGKTVIFPIAIRSETGWDDLFAILDTLVSSNTPDRKRLSPLWSAYSTYCMQYPQNEENIIKKCSPVFGEKFAETIAYGKTQLSIDPTAFCDEKIYRSLLIKTPDELIEIVNTSVVIHN